MQQGTIYLFSFFIAFITSSKLSAQGQVVQYELTNTYTLQDINSFLNSLNIPQGLIVPKYEVDIYRVTYITRNASNTDTTRATGMLAIPKNVSCPLPIASYQHGTTTLRYDVPSYGSSEGKLGAVLTSAVGYISSLPDYLGMGDSPGFHPYVHAHSQATATIDLMRAIRQLQDTLDFNLNGQIALLGYSQGGHATMATHKYIEENLSHEFNIVISIPMSGPYDISGTQSSELFIGGTYESPAYLPYIIMGYQAAYGNIYQDLSDVFVSPYDTMIPRLYNGNYSLGTINRRLPNNVAQMLQPAFYNDFIQNPNHPMRIALADNDVYNWTPQARTHIVYCQGDEQVFAQNSIHTYNTMIANGAQQTTISNHGNRTHTGCLMFALIDAYNIMGEYVDFTGGIEVDLEIRDVIDNNNNGQVIAQATGGIGAYSYIWNDFPNINSNTIENLSRGNYLLAVRDERNCVVYKMAIVNKIVAIHAIDNSNISFKAYPNPTQDYLILENNLAIDTPYEIRVMNTLGQIIWREDKINASHFMLNTSHLKSGIYFVELIYDSQREIFKILIED